MKKAKLILLVCTVICAIAIIGTKLSENRIIIYLGARNYTSMLILCSIATGIFLVATIVCCCIRVHEKETVERTTLSSDNCYRRSDLNDIRDSLEEVVYVKWLMLKDEMDAVFGQLHLCDEYYSNVRNILKSDDASTVCGSDELLGRLRDCAYRNASKLLNYMKALSNADIKKVKSKVKECFDINAQLVENASNFTEAIVNSINNSFDKDEQQRSLLLIESYKETILGVIDDDTKLLQ